MSSETCDFVAYEVLVVVEAKVWPQVTELWHGDRDKRRMAVEGARRELLATIDSELAEHVFTVDTFALDIDEESLRDEPNATIPMATLRGKATVCDGMEDVWFIAHLLREMTRKLPGACLTSMHDQDGDTLLIEAAEALPDWLEPETSQGRIFMFQGNLHLVPPTIVSFGAPSVLCREAILQNPCGTRSSAAVETILAQGPFGTASRAQWASHKFAVAISDALARVAIECPQAIPQAVHALRHADPAARATQAAWKLDHFGPRGPLRLQQISLSRTSYAQLQHFSSHQMADPARYSEREWCAATIAKVSPDRLQQGLRLGLTLAAGLELLISANKNAVYYDAALQLALTTCLAVSTESLAEPTGPPPPDDNDQWIEVEPDALQTVLQQVSGSVASVLVGQDASNLDSLTSEMRALFEAESGFEGIDVPVDEGGDSTQRQSPNSSVSFDVNSLLQVLQGQDLKEETLHGEDGQGNDEQDVEATDSEEDRLLDEAADELLEEELSAEANLTSTFESSGGGGGGLAPLDVDLNLVQSLVNSVTGEGMAAGPASSLMSRLTEDLRAARTSP
ncbi:Protein ecdysoneless [Hondaea fermentalgiana]|uniref:Protein ecdysoneless n=1 Tax=Hondaea fermentalgiana TaxID=2315210 RepID=A0A2R5GMC3_9STRA|nr:Protein ecdysoneless [Hondaea fermentalgiana]|eukprot:GBG32030.1 Protein ecdysoneless [Hondaea fermentalgiana]